MAYKVVYTPWNETIMAIKRIPWAAINHLHYICIRLEWDSQGDNCITKIFDYLFHIQIQNLGKDESWHKILYFSLVW